MSKFNVALLAIAAIQVVLLLVTGRSTDSTPIAERSSSTKPFADINSDDVARLEITDDEGKTLAVELLPAKDDKPASWGLASKGGFPVRESEVKNVLANLSKVNLGRLVTKKRNSLTRLEVSDDRFARHVVVKAKDGRPLADFYLGEGRQHDHVFFRRAGEDAAYHASGVNTYQFLTSSSSWVESTFTDIPFDQVTKVELARESGERVVIEKVERPKKLAEPSEAQAPEEGGPPEEEQLESGKTPPVSEAGESETSESAKPETETVWVLAAPDGPKDLDQTKVDSWVRSFCRLYLAEPIGQEKLPEHGLETPKAQATLTLKDGATHTISVGAKREKENDYYATRSGFDFVVTLRSWSVDDNFEKKVEDLLPKSEDKDDHEGHDHDR